jgi:hypothetical protein
MGVAAGLSMHKLLGEYAHTGIERGLMERRRVSGHPRGFRLHVMLSAQLELALMKSVRHRHRSKSRIVEEALWKDLGGASGAPSTCKTGIPTEFIWLFHPITRIPPLSDGFFRITQMQLGNKFASIRQTQS